jgi:hypothetical protein
MWVTRYRSTLPQPSMLRRRSIEEVVYEVIEERRRTIVTDSGARV